MDKKKVLIIAILVVVGLCIVVLAIGALSGGDTDSEPTEVAAIHQPTVEPTEELVEEERLSDPTPITEPTQAPPTPTKEPTETREPTATKEPETPTSPKGDGIYTINVEIQSGLWESQGTGGFCYWELLDQNQEIMKNSLGDAGGSANLRIDAYEFHSDGCGEWIYVEGTEREPLPDISEPKGNGFYTVGVEISIGTWESQGIGDMCYWELLDQNQEIIKNSLGDAGGAATITTSTYEFHATDCGEWMFLEGMTREPNPDIDEPKGDGFYTVGVEISAGTWESQGADDFCYWERLDRNQNIIDNYLGQAGGSATIQPTDFEFHTQDCGEWIKQ